MLIVASAFRRCVASIEHVTLGRTAHHLQDLVCMRDLHAWLAAAPARVDTVGCKHIWFLEPRTVLRGLQSG